MNQANELRELRLNLYWVYTLDNCMQRWSSSVITHVGIYWFSSSDERNQCRGLRGILSVGVAKESLQLLLFNCNSLWKEFPGLQTKRKWANACCLHACIVKDKPTLDLYQQEVLLHCIMNLCSYHKAEACNADWVHQQQLSPNHPHKPA